MIQNIAVINPIVKTKCQILIDFKSQSYHKKWIRNYIRSKKSLYFYQKCLSASFPLWFNKIVWKRNNTHLKSKRRPFCNSMWHRSWYKLNPISKTRWTFWVSICWICGAISCKTEVRCPFSNVWVRSKRFTMTTTSLC